MGKLYHEWQGGLVSVGWPIPLQQTGDCSADGQQNQKHIRSCREKGCSTGDNKTGGGSVREK